MNMAFLESVIKNLESTVKSFDCPVVFSHNDLLCANIIYNPESKDVAFIDYEYGSFNYRSFDIANHFCEFAGFDCDYSLYPDESVQRQWIREYLCQYNGTAECTKEQIDQVLKEVAVFAVIAHAFWILWALVQAQVSDIDFDYMEYSIKRFVELKRRLALIENM